MQLRSQFRQPVSPHLRGLFGRSVVPDGAILHWDASQGWQDQTGSQQAVLIGSAYPTVSAGYAINASGAEWGFSTTTGPVKAALESGEVTLVQVVTLPLMSTLTDATDYSLFGDLLFVRRDGTAGSFAVSDGTNSATVGYDWTEGEVVRVVVQCDGDVMRIAINAITYVSNCDGLTDTVGANERTVHPMQFIQGPVTLTSSQIVGTETVTKPSGSTTATVSAGQIVVGSGALWSFACSNGSRYEFATPLTPTTGIVFDTSGNGRHLLFTVADTAVTCATSMTQGSDWLNQMGMTVANGDQFYSPVTFGAVPNDVVIPSIEDGAHSAAYLCDVPRMLLVGTSIAAGSTNDFFGDAPRGLVSANTPRGSETITLSAGGVANLGLVAGDYIVCRTHNGGVLRLRVDNIDGEQLTVFPATTEHIFASAHVKKSTSSTSFFPLYQTANTGYIRAINSLLEKPFHICTPSCAFGGMKSDFISAEFPAALARHKPDVVWFNMFDNDINYTDLATILAYGRSVVEQTLAAGAIPVICPSLPANFPVDKIATFDGVVDWVAQVHEEYPGAIGVNPGAVYTITSNPTYPRTFAPGWTDGSIHPLAKKAYAIGLSVFDEVSDALDAASAPIELISSNRFLAGVGGTNMGNVQAGSTIPAGCAAFSNAAHTVTITKTASDVCKFDFSVAGSAVLGSYSWIRVPVVLPVKYSEDVFFAARARIELLNYTNISSIYLWVTDNSGSAVLRGTQYDVFDNTDIPLNTDLVLDTPSLNLYPEITSLNVGIYITPKSATGVSASFLIKEAGIYFVKEGEMV